MKIKLYDLIGTKSGMNFYLEAFCKLLEDNDIETDIISNFGYKGKRQQLPNIFEKSVIKKCINLLTCYIKLIFAILKLKKNEYIVVLLYGVVLDIPLFFLAKLSKKVVLDVHETMALDYKNKIFRKILHYFYKTCSSKIIVHSDKIRNILTGLSQKATIICVPLFPNYNDARYNTNNIGEDVINSFENKNAKYFLFFGNVRPSKGVFELLRASELLDNEDVRIIIAGQDIFDNIKEYTRARNLNKAVKTVLRLINDDEMKYFFAKSHAALLPYTSISQSGVLQTAVSLRVPMLTSDIDYFKQEINNFPSFGKCTNITDPVAFKNSLLDFANEVSEKKFYNKTDVDRYYHNEIFETFVQQLKEILGH